MAIDTECPLCGHKGQVPEKFSGRQVKCPECCNVFNVNGTAGPNGDTSGSQYGTKKIIPNPGSKPGAVQSPTSGSKAGTEKSPTSGSKAGNEKPPTSGSKAGNEKAPTSGSKAGNEKAPIMGNKAGPEKVVTGKAPNERVKKSSETHHGGMKLLQKPAAGTQQGMQKVGKPGDSKQGTQKVSAKANPLRKGGDPFSQFDIHEAADDDDDGYARRRRRRKGGWLPMLLSIALLIPGVIVGYITLQKLGVITESTEVAKATSTDDEPKPTQTKDDPDPKTTFVKEGPIEWVDVSRAPVKFGDVQIKLAGGKVDLVKGMNIEEKDKLFQITLEIENKGANRVDYQSWGTAEAINDPVPPRMTDSAGKAVERKTFSGAKVEGQLFAESIQPNTSVKDVLVFQVPDSSAKFVRLELSGENLGGQGKVRMEIPQRYFATGAPKKDPDPKDPKKDPSDPPAKEPKAVTILRDQLKKAKNLKERTDLVTELGVLGPLAASAAADVVPALKDKSEFLRLAAAEALGKFGPSAAPVAVAPLTAALKDEFFKVQAAAAFSLGRMGPAAKESIPALMELLKSKEEEVPAKAKEAIKKIDPQAVIP